MKHRLYFFNCIPNENFMFYHKSFPINNDRTLYDEFIFIKILHLSVVDVNDNLSVNVFSFPKNTTLYHNVKQIKKYLFSMASLDKKWYSSIL